MATGETFDRADGNSRSPVDPRRLEMRPHLHEALALLLQAYDYAVELSQDPWDLAVELPVLRAARLNNSDLRWLIGIGVVEHAIETTGPTDHTRQFRRTALVSFNDTTCLMLTVAGVQATRDIGVVDNLAALETPAVPCRVVLPEEAMPPPTWDDQRRQLRVGTDIVKEFKLPSPNQETVLIAFEEEGWPPRIDDPLPPLPHLDPRRRLHDTIKALNRKQKVSLLRFMGDGSGEGIRWEHLVDKASSGPRAGGLR